MDITKFKGVGSQMVIYKELRSSKIRYNYTEPEPPTPGVVKHFYWTVDSYMSVDENLRTDRIYSFTFSANTRNGYSHFGTADTTDSNDFRLFWQGRDDQLFLDSGYERVYKRVWGCRYTDLLTYDLTNSSIRIYKENVQKNYFTVSGTLKTSGALAFVSLGNEQLNFYEFKVYDTSNNLLKHYIPLSDGRTLYDVVSGTTLDTGKTFQVFKSYVETNQKGELIPYKD